MNLKVSKVTIDKDFSHEPSLTHLLKNTDNKKRRFDEATGT